MTKHDRGGYRRVAGMHGHDFALSGFGKASRGMAYEAQIAPVLSERGAALALPAAGLERKKDLNRTADFLDAARDAKSHGAVLGKPVALAAQFFQLFGAQRVAQHVVGAAPGVEAGAQM